MIRKLSISSLAVLAFTACSSAPKPAPESGANADEASDTAGEATPTDTAKPAADIGEGVAWAEKSEDQKAAFMRAKIVPAVAAIWGESPAPSADVKCSLCHVAGAPKGEFHMPDSGLPPLNPANSFEAHRDKAEWLDFMGKKLVPTMAETLGVEPYNMETHTGFGCFSCHTMAGGEANP